MKNESNLHIRIVLNIGVYHESAVCFNIFKEKLLTAAGNDPVCFETVLSSTGLL